MAAYEQQRGAGSRPRGGGGGGGRWGGDRQRGGRKEEDSTSIWGNDWDMDAPAESEGHSGGSWQDREGRSGGSWKDREERSGGGWRGSEERSGGGGSWRSNEERGTSSWRGGDRQRSDRRGDGRGEGWGNRDRRGGDRSQQQRYGGDRSQQRYGSERGERRDRWQGREQQAAGGRGAGGYRQAWGEAEGAEGGWGEEAAGAAGAPAGAGGLRQFWIGDVLYGVSPVLAALQAGRREVHTLYLQDGMDLSKRKVGLESRCTVRFDAGDAFAWVQTQRLFTCMPGGGGHMQASAPLLTSSNRLAADRSFVAHHPCCAGQGSHPGCQEARRRAGSPGGVCFQARPQHGGRQPAPPGVFVC